MFRYSAPQTRRCRVSQSNSFHSCLISDYACRHMKQTDLHRLLYPVRDGLAFAMTRKSSNKKGGHPLLPSHHGGNKIKQPEQNLQRAKEAHLCPYHYPILHLEHTPTSGYGQSPMDRFLTESPSEQSSLFRRPDTGKLTTWKECLCGNSRTTSNQTSGNKSTSEAAHGTNRS
jgi:hypothetical protein